MTENEIWKKQNQAYIKSYFKIYVRAGGTPYRGYPKVSTWHRKLPAATADKWVEARKKGCEVCGSHEGTSIDHDHKTDRIRGILCRNCNTSLGLLKDDPQRLVKLAKYLERNHVTKEVLCQETRRD